MTETATNFFLYAFGTAVHAAGNRGPVRRVCDEEEKLTMPKRFQFRLRTLLLATAAIAVLLFVAMHLDVHFSWHPHNDTTGTRSRYLSFDLGWDDRVGFRFSTAGRRAKSRKIRMENGGALNLSQITNGGLRGAARPEAQFEFSFLNLKGL